MGDAAHIHEIQSRIEDPRDVQIYFTIHSVAEINISDFSFTVLFNIAASWLENNPENIEKIISTDETNSFWKPGDFSWIPQLQFPNRLHEDKYFALEWFYVVPYEIKNKPVPETKRGKGTLTEWKTFFEEECGDDPKNVDVLKVTHVLKRKMTFACNFNMRAYPIDMQALKMQISSSWDCSRVRLSFSDEKLSQCDPELLYSQDWKMHSPELIDHKLTKRGLINPTNKDDFPLLTEESRSHTGVRFSQAYICLTVERTLQYYAVSNYIMLIILSSMALTIYAIDVDDIKGRIGSVLTLLLGLVTQKLVLANTTPRISHFTVLDKYTICVILNLFAMGLMMTFIQLGHTSEEATESINIGIFVVSGGIWVLLHLYVLIKFIQGLIKRHKRKTCIKLTFEKIKQDIEDEKEKFSDNPRKSE